MQVKAQDQQISHNFNHIDPNIFTRETVAKSLPSNVKKSNLIARRMLQQEYATKENCERLLTWLDQLIGEVGYLDRSVIKPKKITEFKKRFNTDITPFNLLLYIVSNNPFTDKLKKSLDAITLGVTECRGFLSDRKLKLGNLNEARGELASIASEKLPYKPIISENHGHDDKLGVDLLIPVDGGLIPIQIKTNGNARAHGLINIGKKAERRIKERKGDTAKIFRSGTPSKRNQLSTVIEVDYHIPSVKVHGKSINEIRQELEQAVSQSIESGKILDYDFANENLSLADKIIALDDSGYMKIHHYENTPA